MITYSEALAPMKVAGVVIAAFYSELARADIVYLFVNKVDTYGRSLIPKRKGREVWGELKVVSGLNAYLAAPRTGTDDDEREPVSFFVMLISQKAWNERLETPEQKEAFIDSMLCRCDTGDGDKVATRDFDVKEFHEVVKRRGAWQPELEKFLKVAKQLPLIPGARGKKQTRKKSRPQPVPTAPRRV